MCIRDSFFSVRVGRQTTSRSLSSVKIMEPQALLLRYGDVPEEAERRFFRDVVKVLSSETKGQLEHVFSDLVQGGEVDFAVRCVRHR